MRPAPLLVATDFDGTFADADGQVPAALAAEVERSRRAGLEVMIVTARPPRALAHVRHIAGSVLLAANGAFEVVPATGEVRVLGVFSPAEVHAIARSLAAIPGVGMSAETATRNWCDDAYAGVPPAGFTEPAPAVRAPLTEMTEPTGKILVTSSVLPAVEFHRRVLSAVGDRASLQVSTTDGLAELSPPGVSKGSALTRFAADRGIDPARVWAVGDMPNDIPMLEWSGVAFAVRNADPRVWRVADAIAPPNTAMGIAHVLRAAVRARAIGSIHGL